MPSTVIRLLILSAEMNIHQNLAAEVTQIQPAARLLLMLTLSFFFSFLFLLPIVQDPSLIVADVKVVSVLLSCFLCN